MKIRAGPIPEAYHRQGGLRAEVLSGCIFSTEGLIGEALHIGVKISPAWSSRLFSFAVQSKVSEVGNRLPLISHGAFVPCSACARRSRPSTLPAFIPDLLLTVRPSTP